MRNATLIVVLVTSLFVGRRMKNAPAEDRPTSYSQRFPIATKGDPILLPVHLTGADHQFLLDTATTHHCFDVSMRSQLGASSDTGFTHSVDTGNVQLTVIETPQGWVGDLPIGKSNRSVLFDFAAVRQATGENIRGVLGASFLVGRQVGFDFDQGILTIAEGPDGMTPAGNEYSLRIDESGCPHLDNVRIGERIESFVVGTAEVSSVMVHKWLFDALIADGQLKYKGSVTFLSATGPRTRRWGRLSNLSVGDSQHTNLAITEGNENTIGLGLLKRYLVTIDVSKERIYLRIGRDFHQPDYVNQTGLHIKQIDGKVVVTAVDAESPAHDAGLKEGDHITRLHGRACCDMRLLEVIKLLRESPGRSMSVDVERDGKAVGAIINVPD